MSSIIGEAHGIGVFIRANGASYFGEWKVIRKFITSFVVSRSQNDVRTGAGKYMWSNGDTYEVMIKLITD